MITTANIMARNPCNRYTRGMIVALFGEKALGDPVPPMTTLEELAQMDPDRFDHGYKDMFWVAFVH